MKVVENIQITEDGVGGEKTLWKEEERPWREGKQEEEEEDKGSIRTNKEEQEKEEKILEVNNNEK